MCDHTAMLGDVTMLASHSAVNRKVSITVTVLMNVSSDAIEYRFHK